MVKGDVLQNTHKSALPELGRTPANKLLVPRKGLEPSRPLSHWHLKPARLPIPPPGPGPVSTDRSRACQIGWIRPKYAVQRRSDGVSRNRQMAARSLEFDARKTDPHGIESGHAGH